MNKKKIIIFVCSLLVIFVSILLFILIKNKSEISYNVYFDTDGGFLVEMQTIRKGNKVIKPNDPEKEGYIFVEWTYLDVTYDFNQEVLSDMTLVANYVEFEEDKVTFIVKFDTDGGNLISNQIVVEDQLIIKPDDPTKEGYVFKGWYLDNKEYDFSMKVNDNLELVAKWEKEVDKSSKSSSSSSSSKPSSSSSSSKPSSSSKKGYMVTFDSNGGSTVNSQTVVDGNKAIQPSNPTRNGYNFKGWLLNGSAYNFDSSVTSDITLVAEWEQKKYKIVVSAVDDYSPARILSVYEDGVLISVNEIRYSDGTYLCSGTNPNVNKNVLVGETKFIVVLSDGTYVDAMI